MLPAFQRKYGVQLVGATLIPVVMIKRGAVDYAVSADWTPASGDIRIRKDGGAWADLSYTQLAAIASGGNGASATWDLTLTAANLQAKRVDIMIADTVGAKAVEDQFIIIETFGDANAMYPSDPSANNLAAEASLLASAATMAFGTAVAAGSSTTVVATSAINIFGVTSIGANALAGRSLLFRGDTTTAGLKGCGARIVSNTAGATPVFTLNAADILPAIPVSGDIFAII